MQDVMIPLTVLQGNLASMLADHRPPLSAQHLHAAYNDAHYIASLLHNLGLAAKLEDTDPGTTTVPTRIDDLIRRATTRHRPLTQKTKRGARFCRA